MHPTTMRVGLEPAVPLPVDTQRRGQYKPSNRAGAPDRRRDLEEGNFRQPMRRSELPLAPPPIDREITISEGITVKEISEKLGIKANLVIKKLVDRKIFATINQSLDVKMAEDISREFGASINQVSFEQESTQEVQSAEVEKDLVRRAPVITVMGHVDHGKTSLLDAIRNANVAGREAGGITQHIGAYDITKNDRKIVFIDTPGHEAFTRMRARGAKVTDIVVLVVAADDGVMPQTVEAINHAKAAKVPIIVAINKIDKPDAQPDRIKQQLTDYGLLAEDWGGDVVMVPVSAKSKLNLDLLLEMILLVADIGDYKANLTRPAMGTVLEAELDRGRGPVATVLVQNGTLRVGEFFICGQVFGKVRAMFNSLGEPVKEAEPSTPVEVLGLDALPEVGDSFQVVSDTAKAKQIVMYRESKAREKSMQKGARMTLEQMHDKFKEGDIKELNIILKTDVSGTAEVLAEMLEKLSTDKVRIRVLHKNVGAITETDVLLASASNAIIIGFNVRPERIAASVAEKEKVDIRLHSIIYELTDQMKKAMTGMLEPVFKEVFKGRVSVRDVFKITKVGMVAGCMVTEGSVARNNQVRVFRDNVLVHTGKIESLRRFKDDVSEVKQGFECGVTIANYSDVKPGDELEIFVSERMAAEL
jgi:translation initiation factor IF-2